jgi:hypothetical protein
MNEKQIDRKFTGANKNYGQTTVINKGPKKSMLASSKKFSEDLGINTEFKCINFCKPSMIRIVVCEAKIKL